MKQFYLSISLLILSCSCHNSNFPEDFINNIRKESIKHAEDLNSNNLKQNKFEDSLYTIAFLSLDSGIKSIDKIIKESPNYAPYYKIKGDFYFKYHDYKNAKDNYSIALQLEPFLNATKFRASCYLNLKQYDSCLNDLKSYPEYNKDNFWYIGNYYEARQNLDSAIHFYKMLFREDTIVYKYCKDRIDYLMKNPNPKLFKELNIRDTETVDIYLYSY